MEKVTRPYLLAGLILVIICMAYFAISSIISLFVFDFLAAFAAPSANPLGTLFLIIAIIFIVILAISICGIIFASIGLSKASLPANEFKEKRKFITTALTLACIILALTLITIFSSFSALSLIIAICLGLGVAFIIVAYVKEKQNAPATITNESTPAQE